MNTFDFDEIINRRGTNCVKWDTADSDSVIPMWVADMDFRTAPAVVEALRRRVEHGVFGYTRVPQEYYDAVCTWFSERHGWQILPEQIIYTSGVVPALSAIIKGLTEPGDKVIFQVPAYNCFFSSVRNNGCEVSANAMIEREGRYYIDFEDLERRAADPKAKMLVICNPQNPVGRIWTREELGRMADICRRYNLIAVSDEIHCELTYELDYVPFATVAKEYGISSVCCVSPSKAFNIAGLQIANIVATDSRQRERIDRAININEVCDVNPFGVVGLIAAYREGGEWLDELRGYLWHNYLTVKEYFEKHLPEFTITPLEATYLLWIDVSHSGMTADEVTRLLMEKEALQVNSGTMYGDPTGTHIRLNIACPRTLIHTALPKIASILQK